MPVVKFAQKVNIMLFLLEFKEDEKQNNFCLDTEEETEELTEEEEDIESTPNTSEV